MLLSGGDIRKRLTVADGDHLVVVPTPEPTAFDGASVDLRLGRWFLSFRQTHMTSVPLANSPKSSVSSRVPVAPASADDEHHKALVVESRRARQSFIPFGESYVLHPGSFVLGASLEWLRLPGSLSAYVTGKSSLGRHGLVIETAAGIHPGFSGCLTLELANVGEVPLEIFPGMTICQVFFHETNSQPKSGESKFSGRRKPALGVPSFDPVFQRLVRGERP